MYQQNSVVYGYPSLELEYRWNASKSQCPLKYLALQAGGHEICKEKSPSCLCKPTLLIWDAVMCLLETRVTADRRPHAAPPPSQKQKHRGVEGMDIMKRNVLGACTGNVLFLSMPPPSAFCNWSWDSLCRNLPNVLCFIRTLDHRQIRPKSWKVKLTTVTKNHTKFTTNSYRDFNRAAVA